MHAVFALACALASAPSSRERIDFDRTNGRPLVAHLIVVLADNATQGIVPVPARLGDGKDPGSNLYWGARYGVKSFLSKSTGWSSVQFASEHDDGVLERIVLSKELGRGTRVYLVADAWDGTRMEDALTKFARIASGHDVQPVRVLDGTQTIVLPAGGASHVVAYAGHNGLMEITLANPPPEAANARPRSAIILACISDSYFPQVLKESGAHFLLTTRGLMAPEAYTIDAALTAWFRGDDPRAVKTEAASAYCRWQKCSTRAGERLFATEG